jgi:hypothetical protein
VGTAVAATLNDAIRDAHKEAMRRHTWRFMEASTTINVAEGATTFALPADFKQEVNPEMGDDDGTGFRRMTKILKNGIESRNTTDSGRPLLYRVWEGVGRLYAQADNAYTFMLEYIAWLPEITADSGDLIYTAKNNSFLDTVYPFLELRAVEAGLRRLNNDERADGYDTRAERMLRRLIADDIDIALANQELIMEMPG